MSKNVKFLKYFIKKACKIIRSVVLWYRQLKRRRKTGIFPVFRVLNRSSAFASHLCAEPAAVRCRKEALGRAAKGF